MSKEGDLRVWNIINPPNEPNYHSVLAPRKGRDLIDLMAKQQLRIPAIVSNAFGLEVFEDGEWCEWYNESGDDIGSAFED